MLPVNFPFVVVVILCVGGWRKALITAPAAFVNSAMISRTVMLSAAACLLCDVFRQQKMNDTTISPLRPNKTETNLCISRT